MSSPRRAASFASHAAFVTGRGRRDLVDFLEGAAPALRRGRVPDSSTTGDSAMSAP